MNSLSRYGRITATFQTNIHGDVTLHSASYKKIGGRQAYDAMLPKSAMRKLTNVLAVGMAVEFTTKK